MSRVPQPFVYPIALALSLLLLFGDAKLASTHVIADDMDEATTRDFEVSAISSQDLGSGYLEVEAIMSGTLLRADGTQGSYRVPVTLMYPQNPAQCNGVALQDILNSVFYETFEFTGTAHDPFFPTLFPLARLSLGDSFIQNRGYVYATGQWNKLVIERQREAGTLSDDSLHIDEGTDGYLIIRDLSRFLRTPSEFFTASEPTPCAAEDVIAFGFSQTGMLLREFYFAELNTQLANDPAFDEGLVFEGSLHAVPGSHCRSLTDKEPWFSYSFEDCEGGTPEGQSKVITVNSETDVQITNGWKARPEEEDLGHYRLFELAGVSHIPTPLFPLKLVSLRPVGAAEQDYADSAPVLRAMVEHLHNWIRGTGEPPESAIILGRIGPLDSPFFSNSSWGSDNTLVFITRLGEDGNGLGGVRLPHVRTSLPGTQEVGGPLGVHRGTECDDDPSQSDYILDCQLGGDPSIYNMAGGTFRPYTEFNPGLCSQLYDSHESYVAAVRDAAEHAAEKRWVLDEEVDSVVLAAELKAQEFPGCVPEQYELNHTNSQDTWFLG